MDVLDLPDLVDLPQGITNALLKEVFGDQLEVREPLLGIGDVHSRHRKPLVSFMVSSALAGLVNDNDSIGAVFCRASDVAGLRGDIVPLVVEEPKYHFFTLMDYLARNRAVRMGTTIGIGCDISERATVSTINVFIGDYVTIEPGAYVAPGTVICDGAIIRANATVGVDGFQHQRTSRGIVSPLHDGWLWIGPSAEIGTSSSISRGFSYRHTVIGAAVKMDALCYVAHGASIGEGSIVCAKSAVMGHAVIGRQTWIGPGAVVSSRLEIGDNAKVSLGAIVTTNVPPGAQFSGNFAIPHDVFIEDLKRRATRSSL